MFPRLTAVQFNLFALPVMEGDGEQEPLRPQCPWWSANDARGATGHPSETARTHRAGAKACPAPDMVFYGLSLKPAAGCNPPPAISIYYDYSAFITGGAELQHRASSESICKSLCIAFSHSWRGKGCTNSLL